MDVRTLATLGYVRVGYPPALQRQVSDAMNSWKAFCTLPLGIKKQLSYPESIRDVGYVLRESNGRVKRDDKEFFHARLGMPEQIMTAGRRVNDARATNFIGATNTLLQTIRPLIERFAQEVEKVYKVRGLRSGTMRSQENWTFRYLHYFPNTSGRGEIAHAHVDRGGFTLHLSETHPGAEYLDFAHTWHPLPVSERETVIFPSMGMQHDSGSKLKALCHRVVTTPETAREGRYSMVAFIDFISGMRYDDRGRALQDFEPGFNYSMNHEKFKQLFIAR